MREKVDFKKLDRKQKAGYIWDYYKLPILIVLFLLIFGTYVICEFTKGKEAVATLVTVNAEAGRGYMETDFTDFMEKYDYNPAKQEVAVDTGYTLDSSDPTRDPYSYQALITIVSAGGADVLSADEELFSFLAEAGCFWDLRDFLPEEKLAEYKEDIVYVKLQGTEKEYAAGIRLGKDSWFGRNQYYKEDCVVGVAAGTIHKEGAGRLLDYILFAEKE